MSNDNPTPPTRQNPSSTPDQSQPTQSSSNNKTQAQKNSNPNQNQEPSLLNRIQSSATGLLRGTITNPNAHALGSDLGQLHGGAVNGKGSSSSAARWAGVNGSQQYDSAAGGGLSSSSSSSRIGAAEGFRSASASQENHTLFEPESFNQEEEYFQNDFYGDEYIETKGKGKEKTSTSFPSSIPMDLSSSFDEYYEAAWIRHTAAAQHSNNNQHHDTQNQTQQQQQQQQNPAHQDGAAVVSLLSDPSFQPDFADDNDNDHYLYEDTTTPAPLTADDIRILESFRRQQSSSSETHHKPNNTITPHSLIPDIDTFLAGISVGGTSDAALRDAVLHNLPGAEDWMAVNDRYQDEVWGYLRPALEAASKEIEENEREGEPAREGPAVRRLKMILRHMQL